MLIHDGQTFFEGQVAELEPLKQIPTWLWWLIVPVTLLVILFWWLRQRS